RGRRRRSRRRGRAGSGGRGRRRRGRRRRGRGGGRGGRRRRRRSRCGVDLDGRRHARVDRTVVGVRVGLVEGERERLARGDRRGGEGLAVIGGDGVGRLIGGVGPLHRRPDGD